MNDVKRECPVESIHKSRPSAIDSACASCPNRKPSEMEQELHGMVDALAKQANEEERLKVYNAELVAERDNTIKELRAMLFTKHPCDTKYGDPANSVLPCPHCGGYAEGHHNQYGERFARCQAGCTGNPTWFHVKLWNRRAPRDQYGGSRESTTCWTCEENQRCEWAWDPYNTQGDCLASK